MHLKPCLSRLRSVYFDRAVFFITCCTHNRRPLLANDDTHQAFTTYCTASKAGNILIGRYVIMPDHLHFFVHFSNPDDLAVWIKSLKNSLSKSLRAQSVAAPHWQRNYFDHLLRSDESYDEKWIYVRLNPLRAGLVTDVCDWPYQGEITMLE